jgi:glycosyltransferase involved in cell wall biosynthesis
MKDSRYQTKYDIVFSKLSEKKAKISVIIPVYNYSKYIEETLDSVKSQNTEILDLVVVDDKSTDNSLKVISDWFFINQKRFNNLILISLKKNYGVTYARNTAIENTKTELIFTLDADNTIYPECLEELNYYLSLSDASFAYPILQQFGMKDGLMNTSFWDIERLKQENYIDNMVLLRKSIWELVGGYSNHIPIFGWEDYDFWFKIARVGGWGVQVPKILGKYRVHKKSLINSYTKKYISELKDYIITEYADFFQINKSDNSKFRNFHNPLVSDLQKSTVNLLNSQLRNARNTLSWKVMVLLHRINNELFKKFNPDFFKWLYYRLFTKKMPAHLDLSKYEPIDFNIISELHTQNCSYDMWLKNYYLLNNIKRKQIEYIIEKFSIKPKISIIMPTYNSNVNWLKEAIESVKSQLYSNWELCIADDASENPYLKELIKEYSDEDSRIKVVFRDKNGHISAASNSALKLTTGEFTGILDHDDMISEDALFWVVYYYNQNLNAKLIYSDYDKLNSYGNLIFPFFKPDWNYQMLLRINNINHFTLYNTEIMKAIGGFREGYEGSQDYDLTLRFIEIIDDSSIIHIPKILYHWRMHDESLAQNISAKEYAYEASTKAIQEHFARLNIDAEVIENPNKTKRIKYNLPKNKPLVSIIIPTKDNYDLLNKCVSSILKKTTYKNYEIIVVNNNSTCITTIEYLAELNNYKKISVIEDNGDFNYSRINNYAVKFAKGDLLCLLNDDTEVITENWLEEMVGHIIQKNIGIVGAKLLFPNKTIQHAGVIIGLMNGAAGHILSHEEDLDINGFGRGHIAQNFSAVTGACMLIRKTIFEKVGGLDEEFLKVTFNDIDLCLKVKSKGYDIVWTPYAKLYHKESASRGYDDTIEKQNLSKYESKIFIERWKNFIKHDPAFNPNLSLKSTKYEIAEESRAIQIEDIFTELVIKNQFEDKNTN